MKQPTPSWAEQLGSTLRERRKFLRLTQGKELLRSRLPALAG